MHVFLCVARRVCFLWPRSKRWPTAAIAFDAPSASRTPCLAGASRSSAAAGRRRRAPSGSGYTFQRPAVRRRRNGPAAQGNASISVDMTSNAPPNPARSSAAVGRRGCAPPLAALANFLSSSAKSSRLVFRAVTTLFASSRPWIDAITRNPYTFVIQPGCDPNGLPARFDGCYTPSAPHKERYKTRTDAKKLQS